MKRWQIGLMAVLLLAAAAAAYGNPADRPNFIAPVALGAGKWSVDADIRLFAGHNDTHSARASLGLGKRREVSLSFVRFDNTGPDLVAGQLIRSKLLSIGGVYRWVIDPENVGGGGAALEVGVEEPMTSHSINITTGEVVKFKQPVATAVLALTQTPKEGVRLNLQPKLVVFDATGDSSLGGSVPGFGPVVGLGIGTNIKVHRNLHLYGNVTPILRGHNSVNVSTGALRRKAPWTVGGRADFTCPFTHLDMFADVYWTTAAGPTAATSLITAPDDTARVAVRLGWEF